MKFYIFLFILFLRLLNPILSQDTKQRVKFDPMHQTGEDCLPGCSNRLETHCTKFDIELRATMTKCSNYVSPFSSSTSKTKKNCPAKMKCGKKLRATLKIFNQGESTVDSQYIIIDHVTDTASGSRVSLLNPYVVIIRQKPLMQLYGLKRQSMVNGEAKEHVINKMDPEFSGCDDLSGTPTCGSVRFNGDVVPYSQGFCCSCDQKINVKRQPRSTDTQAKPTNFTNNFQNLMFEHMNSNENNREKKSTVLEPKDFNDYRSSIRLNGKSQMIYVSPRTTKKKVSRKADIFFKAPSSYDPFEHDKNLLRKNRQENSIKNIQVRGGQNCDKGFTPVTKVNPNTYHDSAHCLRFSNLWYAMYQLSDPIMDHSVYIKIFEKRDIDNGNTEWADLTKGLTINVGTLTCKFEDVNVKVTYDGMAQSAQPISFALDSRRKRLLIPQRKTEGIDSTPESQGGPSEYLIVDKKDVQPSGDICDTAGVGYAAFYNQPNRCSAQRGTCLKNQPSELWRRDKKTCMGERRGKYFLKNYATVPHDALRKTKRGDSNYLALNYNNIYKSSVDIEIKADDNIAFRSTPTAQIAEVYVDSTSSTATILTIKIHNNGLVSNVFRPRLTDCPLELPVDWGNLEGEAMVIAPQHNSIFVLRLLGKLPVKNFYCTVEALSARNEIVAVRRIRVIKNDRCICSWHCLCACYFNTGLGCVLMSMEHYKAAGFIGSMPLTTTMVRVSYFETVMFGFVFFAVLLVMILLVMGLTKALIGFLFFVPVGIWGLDMIIGLRPLESYYECELQGRLVLYDDDGWPVHPDTRQRDVRIVEERIEFCLNVIFFFAYPVMLMLILCAKCCCPIYTYCGDDDNMDAFFRGNNTVRFSKCTPSKASSCESDYNSDMFNFE